MAEPVGDRVAVRAPATSANLGPGFDSVAVCLDLYDDLTATRLEPGKLEVTASGEGAAAVPRNGEHLVVRAMTATFDRLGVAVPGIALTTVNRIPHGRGLGSSAAAIVAGIRLAEALSGIELPEGRALRLADELEGHPDNVAACLSGGLTVAWRGADGVDAVRLPVARLAATVFVPAGEVSTELARSLLPSVVPHEVAAANGARCALLVAAMTGRPDLLLAATEDRLHQSFRAPAMPDSAALLTRLRASGHAAAVSGAGPSVVVLSEDPLPRPTGMAPDGWRVLELSVSPRGCARFASGEGLLEGSSSPRE